MSTVGSPPAKLVIPGGSQSGPGSDLSRTSSLASDPDGSVSVGPPEGFEVGETRVTRAQVAVAAAEPKPVHVVRHEEVQVTLEEDNKHK